MTNISKRQVQPEPSPEDAEESNRAERRRRKRQEKDFWNKMVTRREVAFYLDNYDRDAGVPVREFLVALHDWLTLPLWKRAWLTIRGKRPEFPPLPVDPAS